MSLKLIHKGLILVAIPLVFELIFVGVLMFVLKNAENEIWKERHSKSVLSESNALLKNIMDTELSLYMYGSTSSETALERFKELNKQIPEQISHLKALLRNSSNKTEAYDRLLNIGNRTSQLLAQGSELVADRSAVKRITENREAMESLLSSLTTELRAFVKDQEKSEQVDPQAEANSRMVVIYCLLAGLVLNIIIAVSLAVYFNKGTAKRLIVLMDNADRITRNQPLHQMIEGNDEIAHLDQVLHSLAVNSQGAPKKQDR